nr:NAD(P)(+) transhydrogenase (Re/Si-specific) subunit beta [Paraburkholderia rhynchosiae]
MTVAMAGVIAGGARLAQRRNVTRGPGLVALLASGMGLSIVSIGVGCYLSALSSLSAANRASLATLERVELYTAVFIGALIFATSAVAFCKLRGVLPVRAVVPPGHDIVTLAALLLCVWLGYGFVTEQTQPFGLAALLAMSALASSMGVHVMLSRECSKGHAHAGGIPMNRRNKIEAEGVRDAGKVRAAAYRHRRRWHNSRNGQRLTQACAVRRLSNRSALTRAR